jgi:outer membrane protein TolC
MAHRAVAGATTGQIFPDAVVFSFPRERAGRIGHSDKAPSLRRSGSTSRGEQRLGRSRRNPPGSADSFRTAHDSAGIDTALLQDGDCGRLKTPLAAASASWGARRVDSRQFPCAPAHCWGCPM